MSMGASSVWDAPMLILTLYPNSLTIWLVGAMLYLHKRPLTSRTIVAANSTNSTERVGVSAAASRCYRRAALGAVRVCEMIVHR